MLALATSWTPDVLAELPAGFRAACHWSLYAQTIAGPEGLPNTEVPAGGKRTPEMAKLSIQVKSLRDLLFPADV